MPMPISEEHRIASQEAVLTTLYRLGQPVTIDELMRHLPKRVGHPWTANRIRPACSELSSRKLDTPLTKQQPGAGRSDRGHPASLWSLTLAGRLRAEELIEALEKRKAA